MPFSVPGGGPVFPWVSALTGVLQICFHRGAHLGPLLLRSLTALGLLWQRFLAQACSGRSWLLGPTPLEVADSGLVHRGLWFGPTSSAVVSLYLLPWRSFTQACISGRCWLMHTSVKVTGSYLLLLGSLPWACSD